MLCPDCYIDSYFHHNCCVKKLEFTNHTNIFVQQKKVALTQYRVIWRIKPCLSRKPGWRKRFWTIRGCLVYKTRILKKNHEVLQLPSKPTYVVGRVQFGPPSPPYYSFSPLSRPVSPPIPPPVSPLSPKSSASNSLSLFLPVSSASISPSPKHTLHRQVYHWDYHMTTTKEGRCKNRGMYHRRMAWVGGRWG